MPTEIKGTPKWASQWGFQIMNGEEVWASLKDLKQL
jgi:hypothetical protein